MTRKKIADFYYRPLNEGGPRTVNTPSTLNVMRFDVLEQPGSDR
jgi:hypothetical protein